MTNIENYDSDKLMVYQHKQNHYALILFCVFVALFSIFLFFSESYIAGIIFGLVFCVLVWMYPWKDKNNPKLIIDKCGIHRSYITISTWNEIKNIEIRRDIDSEGIQHKKLIINTYEIELDDLELDINDLENIIKKYRTPM